MQMKYFRRKITDLSNSKNVERNYNVYSLNLELGDNRIKKKRLNFENFSESAKYLWLLPSNFRFVELLISDDEEKVLHTGLELILNQLRD